jgi:hypothetical protein
MIRCYMGADKVVGFGHQFIKALIPRHPRVLTPAAQPGRPRTARMQRRSRHCGRRWKPSGRRG